MKNLKRALSLVLSAAMMVGMMVVGTGAAEFTDAKGHDHEAAIELMAMIGVMEGDGENFNPDNIVTRNEMAVVMCNLLDLKLNGDHPFTDVAAWADDYVAAIYTNGYTAGKSATTFGGSDKITTAEAALMIMKTLGYFEFQGEFGSDWKLATIKQATKLALLEDIDAGINEYLTRGEVAEMVMAALDEYVVIAEEIGGMSVEGNGISVTEKPMYNHYQIDDNYNDGDNQTLTEKLFGRDLTPADYEVNKSTVDAFGRPAVKWTYTGNGKTETVTVAYDPTIVFTAAKSDDDISKALKDYTYASTENAYIDGTSATPVALADLDTKTGNGATVEIYMDKVDVDRIVIVNEYLGKVTGVTPADEKTGADRYVTVGSKNFETESFDRKDMVIYTLADNVIKSMKLAETVEGKITSKDDDNSFIKLDGVSFKSNDKVTASNPAADSVNFGASDYNVGNNVIVYVDTNGNVIGLKEVVKADITVEDYVVVVEVAPNKDTFNKQQVKILFADGTKKTVTVDESSTKSGFDSTPDVNTLYTIEETSDGVEFYAAPSAADAGFDEKAASGGSYSMAYDKDTATIGTYRIADDAVIFVQYVENSTTKHKIMTGAEIKKLADGEITAVAAAYADKAANGFATIQLAYVTASTVTSVDAISYGYVVAAVESVKNADDKDVKAVTFWNGTENVTVMTANVSGEISAAAGMVKGDFFSYKLNEKGELTNINAFTSTDEIAVTAVDGKHIEVDDTTIYEIDEDTVVIYVDTENFKGIASGEIVVADEIFNNSTGAVIGYTDNAVAKFTTTLTEQTVDVIFVDVNNKLQ